MSLSGGGRVENVTVNYSPTQLVLQGEIVRIPAWSRGTSWRRSAGRPSSGRATTPSWWEMGGRRYAGIMQRRRKPPWERNGPLHRSRRMTAGEDLADMGVAVGSPLNRQWDGVRVSVMEVLPLPALRHRSTWLAVPLWWLWVGLLGLPCPELQEGGTRHGLSQQASWWGRQPFRKGLHPWSRARRPQTIYRLRHAGGGQVPNLRLDRKSVVS